MSLDIARPRAISAPIVVATARYVLLPLANLLTGYSVKAMERKIERGDWQEGKVWRRAPDGRIVIDVLGYQRWVEGPSTGSSQAKRLRVRRRGSLCRWTWRSDARRGPKGMEMRRHKHF